MRRSGCFDSRRHVNSDVIPKIKIMRKFGIVHVCWLLAFFSLLPFTAARGQNVAPIPPPLGRLVDIGSRRLHLYCVGHSLLLSSSKMANRPLILDWGLVNRRSRKSLRSAHDRPDTRGAGEVHATGSVEQTTDDLHLLLHMAVRSPM